MLVVVAVVVVVVGVMGDLAMVTVSDPREEGEGEGEREGREMRGGKSWVQEGTGGLLEHSPSSGRMGMPE